MDCFTMKWSARKNGGITFNSHKNKTKPMTIRFGALCCNGRYHFFHSKAKYLMNKQTLVTNRWKKRCIPFSSFSLIVQGLVFMAKYYSKQMIHLETLKWEWERNPSWKTKDRYFLALFPANITVVVK